VNLLVTATVVVLLWLRRFGFVGFDKSQRFAVALTVVAIPAVISYTNEFQFHGARHWIHLHDVAHYYLGSKYFAELGYGDLYVAMLRAEVETSGNVSSTETARDLSGNFLAPAQSILSRSDEVKSRFSADRWDAFRKDVDTFRKAMGPRYGEVLRDHGYNPTPVWTLIGGSLANIVPAGSMRGIGLLTALDPLLVVMTLVAIRSSFGLATALLVLVYYCVCFGAGFDWTGGAFLRELSWAAILLCACALKRGHALTAGVILALAATLRIFPGLLAIGAVTRAALEYRTNGAPSRDTRRFLIGFVVAAVALVAASVIRLNGISPWQEFARNISAHSQSASANVIGLTSWAAFLRSFDVSTRQGFEALVHWRTTAYHLQLILLVPVTFAFVAARSRRDDLLAALGLGSLLVLCSLNISAYYYKYLALLLLVHRNDDEALAWLFSIEFAMYLLASIEHHQVMLYLYKSLLVLGGLLLIYARGIREEISALTGTTSARPGTQGSAA